jgi:hypothetical protein
MRYRNAFLETSMIRYLLKKESSDFLLENLSSIELNFLCLADKNLDVDVYLRCLEVEDKNLEEEIGITIEKLLNLDEIEREYFLSRLFSGVKGMKVLENLLENIEKTDSNKKFGQQPQWLLCKGQILKKMLYLKFEERLTDKAINSLKALFPEMPSAFFLSDYKKFIISNMENAKDTIVVETIKNGARKKLFHLFSFFIFYYFIIFIFYYICK